MHYRAGAAREPGVTGSVSRGDHAQETGKQPVSPARATSSLAFLAHGALAVAFAAMSVLLAVAPETVWVLVCDFHCLVAASTSVDVVCEEKFSGWCHTGYVPCRQVAEIAFGRNVTLAAPAEEACPCIVTI